MPIGLVGFDKRALDGAACLVGIDEAGRGCLAGPVVAAAVRCERAFYSTPWCRRHSRGVNDSKCLRADKRAAIVERFREACHENWIQIGIGTASVEEIEEHNIFQANSLAMRRALGKILDLEEGTLWGRGSDTSPPATVLIDGRPIRNFPVPHRGVVKGDRQSLAVALAGIHAKEHRDSLMRELDKSCPGYGFAVHKGYGTSRHLKALRERGPSPHHRRLFLRKVLQEGTASPDVSQDSLF